jgi:hypothetical protein
MSFPRHGQIYQSDVLFRPRNEAVSGFAPGLIVLMSLLPLFLGRLPASASPAESHSDSISRNCKPPPGGGWGIFDRRNEEFSAALTQELVNILVELESDGDLAPFEPDRRC